MAESYCDKSEAELLRVGDVAGLLSCSARHVFRLSDCGKMPGPVKLGALVRWRRAEIMNWLSAGCPSCCHVGGACQ